MPRSGSAACGLSWSATRNRRGWRCGADLEAIGGIPVIFVTAYDEFALRAFEVHAVDYLLKPFARERRARVELYAKDSRVAILTDGTKLPVRRAGHRRLQQLL